MKKATYITGVLGILSVVIGWAVLKLHHLELANYFISIGELFNAIIVLPLITIYLYRKNVPNKNLFMFGLFSMFLLMVGLFFKFMHWAGSLEISIAGGLLFIVSVVLIALDLYKRDNAII